jgi:glycosyltransferase involved in cell wall biosynthesis
MGSSWSLKERLFARLWRGQITRIGKRALFGGGRVMVLSRNLKDQLLDLYGSPAAPLEINPPGVDSRRFAPGERDPDLARRFGLRPGTVVLLQVGRLSPEKNLPFLIRAAAPLLRSGKARLLIAGDGPEKKRLEAAIARENLRDRAVLTGETGRPEDLYRLSDIFVSASRYESFGQTILEAMSSGLPVVALKRSPPEILTAAEEIIREEKSGFCVPAEAGAAREKLKLLIDQPDLRRRMGEAGRAACRADYTWERHVEKLLKPAETA